MNRFVLKMVARPILLACVSVIIGPVWAVGGPPLVTDDPDTPGDGHWEINLAALSQRTINGYSVNLPDADINYGLGDNVQLKADMPWTYAQEPGSEWKSGPGFANFGVKWRFIDEEQSGYSVSTYPQYFHSLSSSSIDRGVASAGSQFFLPFEVSGKVGEFDLDGEVGRNFVQNKPNQWEAGIVVGHDCGKDLQCLVEVHETYTQSTSGAGGSTLTLLNLGLTWKLTETLTLLAAAGREVGKQTPDQLQSLFYLGLQITR